MAKRRKKKIPFSFVRWLLLLGIPLIWCTLDNYGLLDFFENRTIDWRFKARGEIKAPVQIVYVDVDSQSLSEIGGWPWSRMYFARVASALLDQLDDSTDDAGYLLEVTSRGVDRPLTAERHYRRARGRRVEVTLTDGSHVTGRLGEMSDGLVRLVVADRGRALTVRELALDDVANAVVQVEFSPPNPLELELAGVSGKEDDE